VEGGGKNLCKTVLEKCEVTEEIPQGATEGANKPFSGTVLGRGCQAEKVKTKKKREHKKKGERRNQFWEAASRRCN